MKKPRGRTWRTVTCVVLARTGECGSAGTFQPVFQSRVQWRTQSWGMTCSDLGSRKILPAAVWRRVHSGQDQLGGRRVRTGRPQRGDSQVGLTELGLGRAAELGARGKTFRLLVTQGRREPVPDAEKGEGRVAEREGGSGHVWSGTLRCRTSPSPSGQGASRTSGRGWPGGAQRGRGCRGP